MILDWLCAALLFLSVGALSVVDDAMAFVQRSAWTQQGMYVMPDKADFARSGSKFEVYQNWGREEERASALGLGQEHMKNFANVFDTVSPEALSACVARKAELRSQALKESSSDQDVCIGMNKVGVENGTGGMSMCGYDDLEKRRAQSDVTGREPACTVMSFGFGTDALVERQLVFMMKSFACKAFMFDASVAKLPNEFSPALGPQPVEQVFYPTNDALSYTGQVSFRKYGLARRSRGGRAAGSSINAAISLPEAMDQMNVSFIDVLKLVANDGEYTALIPLLEQSRPGIDKLLFAQLLMEVPVNAKDDEDLRELIFLLKKNGYTLFSQEINDKTAGIVYSFIHYDAWHSRQCEHGDLAPQAKPCVSFNDDATAVAIAHAQGYNAKGCSSLEQYCETSNVSSASQMQTHCPWTCGVCPKGTTDPDMRFIRGRHVKRKNAAIYMLLLADRSGDMELDAIQALGRIHTNFNWEYRYPVVVFTDWAGVTDEVKEQFMHAIKKVTASLYEVRIKDVTEFFAEPLKEGRSDNCSCMAQKRVYDGRSLHQFFAIRAPQLLHDHYGFEWAMRWDLERADFIAPVGYDPFQVMANNGWKFAAAAQTETLPECEEGLWKLASAYVRDASHKALPHGTAYFDQQKPGTAYLGGLEISHVSVWQSSAYQGWIKKVEKSGGIFSQRWSNGAIRLLGVSMALKPSQVHALTDIGLKIQTGDEIELLQEPKGLTNAGLSWKMPSSRRQDSRHACPTCECHW